MARIRTTRKHAIKLLWLNWSSNTPTSFAKELAEAGAVSKKKAGSTKRSRKSEDEPIDDEAAMASHLMTRKVKRAYQKAMQEKVAKRAKSARLGSRATALKTGPAE